MRKLPIVVICVAVLLALMLLPALALASSSNVTGVVYHNGSPVDNATVTVTCNGHTETDTTGSNGVYDCEVSPISVWPAGAPFTITAVGPGGLHGGPVAGSPTTIQPTYVHSGAINTKVNLTEVDVSVIPEYGAIAGGAAIALGACAFLFIRRRRIGVAS
jgi:hypothetical protein